jgi:hypothetical protein
LGAFFFNVQGEPIIITQMIMDCVTSTTAGVVSNVTVYDQNGVVVAGPQDLTNAPTDTVTLTDTFTAPIGIKKYIVKGDLDSGFSANDTILFRFATPGTKITAKGEVTNNTITPTPSSNITGDTVTVKTGDLNVSVSSSPAAQTVAAGTSGFTFGNFVLDATQSGENVKITQIKVKHTTSAADIHSYITGITLYDGATALNTPQAGESSTSVSSATSTITLTNPLIIAKGVAKTLVLKGDISGSAANNSTHTFGLVDSSITAYGASTSNSITADYTQSHGQTMTVTTGGTLRMSEDGSNPALGLVVADSTNTIGVFNFEAKYESIDVQKIGLTISSGTTSYKEIDWLQLYDGSTKLGEIQVTGAAATITPSSLVIPLNTTKTLTLKAVTQKVGPSESGTSGNNFIVTITGMDVKGVSTGTTTITKSGLDSVNTNAQYNFKTKPTVTKVNLSGMANGTEDLYKFTIAADSKGEVGFYKATFAITTTSATVTNFKFYEIDGSTETDLSATALTGDEQLTANVNNADGKFAINSGIDTSAIAGLGEMRSIGAGTTKTYVLRGDVTGWDANASIQMQMLSDDTAATIQNAAGIEDDASDNFIWSDLNYGYTSTTATTTVQWTNGYKVFATSSQSF